MSILFDLFLCGPRRMNKENNFGLFLCFFPFLFFIFALSLVLFFSFFFLWIDDAKRPRMQAMDLTDYKQQEQRPHILLQKNWEGGRDGRENYVPQLT